MTSKPRHNKQATLIIRHPDDGKLYVNFDQEILQLIREAKILDRMGIEIPESAKIALFQVSEGEGWKVDFIVGLRRKTSIDEIFPREMLERATAGRRSFEHILARTTTIVLFSYFDIMEEITAIAQACGW